MSDGVNKKFTLFNLWEDISRDAFYALKMPIICNKCLKVSLIKDDFFTTWCVFAVFSTRSHSIVAFVHAQTTSFCSFHYKIDWASLKMKTFNICGFNIRGPLHELKGAQDWCTFFRWVVRVVTIFRFHCNSHQLRRTIWSPHWPIWCPSLQFEDGEGYLKKYSRGY